MTSIERTAHPRFKRLITAHELHLLFSPSRDELEWAADATDCDEHLPALLLMLKSYRRMGCFPALEDRDSDGTTLFNRLKKPAKGPTWSHFKNLTKRLERLDELGDTDVWMDGVAAGKVTDFAGEADAADASELRDFVPVKRIALVAALTHKARMRVRDDLATMFCKRVATKIKKAKAELEEIRLAEREIVESDAPLRRRVTAATNKVESFNRFSQWIGFGNRGVIADNDPTEQEKAMKFNALLTNAVIFHNALDIAEIVRQLLEEGWEIDPEDLAHISPYLTEHINRFGEYSTHELGIQPEAYDPKLGVDWRSTWSISAGATLSTAAFAR
ncbi:Tn3 family transposase [Streptosporangium sp. NPDC049304]|uniref:Tn3 family transposase n=1 Tax=Streptosporangium sp. NPDC049304 TaxID=3154830 RepID=UPI003439864C